jgi:hypothetical protein
MLGRLRGLELTYDELPWVSVYLQEAASDQPEELVGLVLTEIHLEQDRLKLGTGQCTCGGQCQGTCQKCLCQAETVAEPVG